EHAPFIAMIALIWARLPLAPDLTEAPKSLLTPVAIGHQFKKVAQEEGWITRKEFLEFDKSLDQFKDDIVEPKLDKFQSTLDNIAKKINALVNTPERPDAQQLASQLAEKLKTISTAPALDTQKIAGGIAEQVVASAKSHFKGIYLLAMALVFMVGLFVGAWAYSLGVNHTPPTIQLAPHSAR
ncbi:MAG: hypothetical protein LBH31_02985, partial [Burkholderiaceae bacterium]|nr:hypothetical protein [Burkholderiaceae bacterium]